MDNRTLLDKLYDLWAAPSATDGEKMNAGAAYLKKSGKLIDMHLVNFPRQPQNNNPFRREAATADPFGDYASWQRYAQRREAEARAERERERQRANNPYYPYSNYSDWAAARQAEAARAAARRRARSTRRSSSSSASRDYSSRGWSRHAGGWIDEDGRYHDAAGRYAKRPR